MAKMHSRKKGQSKSRRPDTAIGVPAWVDYKKDEVEKLVLKLRKQELSTALIGTVLRDQYGIPAVKDITGKSVSQILKEHDAYPKLPEDLRNLLKKVVTVSEHMDNNRKDYHSKRGLFLTESKIRRLVKYYKSTHVLADDWQYDRSRAKLLIQ